MSFSAGHISGSFQAEIIAEPTDQVSGGVVHAPKRPPGRPRKRPPQGAAAIAAALGGHGLAGSFRNTYGMLKAIADEGDRQAVLDPAEWRARMEETELARRADLLRPKDYDGQRINATARMSAQAEPIKRPPKLPKPWTSAEQEPRDWDKIAHSVQRACREGIGWAPSLLCVHQSELLGVGQLQFNRQPDYESNLRLNGVVQYKPSSGQDLQSLADLADMLIVHSDLDALVVSCRTAICLQLRDYLSESGHAAASASLERAARLHEDRLDKYDRLLLDWIYERSLHDPGKGSSHTGITVDAGIHDGQMAGQSLGGGGGGIANTLRGGNAHIMTVSTVGGKLTPSSAALRATDYWIHRAHVKNGKRVVDRRFDKISRARLSRETSVHTSKQVRTPAARADHSFPPVHDAGNMEGIQFEGELRAAAADLSLAFFAAIPGVDALCRVQRALAEAEVSMTQTQDGCPFVGASSHLYPKGSIGLMGSKKGHDDRNGPASSTFWQNLGQGASGARTRLVAVVNGCDVCIHAPVGQFALFAGWLPHLTDTVDGRGSPRDWRMHHTGYCRFDTEYFGWVAHAHREAGVPLQFRGI